MHSEGTVEFWLKRGKRKWKFYSEPLTKRNIKKLNKLGIEISNLKK